MAWRYEFYFLVAKTIFYSLAALVRKILFCHSKIKFISSRHRVISSIYKLTKCNINYYISICLHSTMLTELEPSFSLRPYGPDHYLAEAKRLKHKADSSVSISIKFTILSSNTICGKSCGSSQAFLFLCANSDEDIATYIGWYLVLLWNIFFLIQ